jgi:hypothetical protein
MKWLLTCALTVLITASGCASRSSYAVPSSGRFFVVQEPGGKQHFTVVDSHAVEEYEEVFQQATPLAGGSASEAKADFEFVEIVDGRAVKQYALYRGGEIFSDGRWYRVDARWHYRWRIMYDPAHAAEFLKKGEPAGTDNGRAAPGRV